MVTYRSTGAWGSGKGAPLTAAEVDANFYELKQLANDLIARPTDPVVIDRVAVINGGVYFYLTDATEYGPFYLPQAPFRFRGSWEAGETYMRRDIFTVDGLGLVICLIPHVAPAVWDLNTKTTGGEFVYRWMFPESQYYDMCYYLPGVVGAGFPRTSPLMQVVAARSIFLPASTIEYTSGYATLQASDSIDIVLPIHVNGVEVGTIYFAAGSTVGVVTVPAHAFLAAGDVLTIQQPELGSEDQISTAADMSVTLKVLRGSA